MGNLANRYVDTALPKPVARIAAGLREAIAVTKREIKPARVHMGAVPARSAPGRETKPAAIVSNTPAPQSNTADASPFDKRAYQRAYMRKLRAAQKAKT